MSRGHSPLEDGAFGSTRRSRRSLDGETSSLSRRSRMACAMRSSSSATSYGLERYWKAPRLVASTAPVSWPNAVTMITGSVGWALRSRSSRSSPFIPSIWTSEMTASKAWRPIASMAAAPLGASSHE